MNIRGERISRKIGGLFLLGFARGLRVRIQNPLWADALGIVHGKHLERGQTPPPYHVFAFQGRGGLGKHFIFSLSEFEDVDATGEYASEQM
jgi:hypothetical protein